MSTDTEKYLDAALASTTFSKSQLDMLQAKIAESEKKTGVFELKTTATIDGVEIGAPYKTVALVKEGKIHRDNGPAVAIDDLVPSPDGLGVREAKTVMYMRDGVPHREDGPAVLVANGNTLWMKNGELHRDNGPAAMIDGKPIFALEGKALSAEEFGKRAGLGEPGKDWVVEPNTGTMFTGLRGESPAVVTMRDAVAHKPEVVVTATAPDQQLATRAVEQKPKQRSKGPEL